MKSGNFGLYQNIMDGYFTTFSVIYIYIYIYMYMGVCVCVCVSKNIAKPHFVSISLCTSWPSYFKKCQEVSDVGFIILTCRLKGKVKYCLGLKTRGF